MGAVNKNNDVIAVDVYSIAKRSWGGVFLTASVVFDQLCFEVQVFVDILVSKQHSTDVSRCLTSATCQVHRLIHHPLDEVAVTIKRVIRQISANDDKKLA